MRWSTSDSPIPATRSSRPTRRTPVESRARRDSTCPANMAFNSCGGPGSRITMRPLVSSHRPGAVPRSLSRTAAPSGTIAWRAFTSDIVRPSWRKRASILLITAGSRASFLPKRSATASRVRSSSVGPSPPLAITSSTRWHASSNALRNGARSSPTTVLRVTSMPSRLSSAVRKRELVSTRSGVSSSDPTAMISAFMIELAWKRKAFHFPIDGEERAGGGEDRAVAGHEREAHEAGAAKNKFCAPVHGNSHDAAAALIGRRHVEISLAVESEALRPAEAAEERADFAFLIDAQHAVETRGGRARDKQFARGAERQVIGRHRWFERGEDENLAVGADLENRAAAIAHKKVADGVERDSSGHAHAFHPKLRAAIGRDTMDGSVVTAGDVEIALAIERQARGIHELSDKGFYCIVRRDLVERDGDFLAAMAAIGDVDISFHVDRWICHGMKIVGNLHAQVEREGLAR